MYLVSVHMFVCACVCVFVYMCVDTYLYFSGLSAETAKKQGESESRSVMSNSLQPRGLYSPWNSPGQNTRVGNCSFLWGIFPTQGSNQVPCIAGRFFTSWATREAQEAWEWLAYPFSRGSSRPRNWTRVSELQADSLPTELSGKLACTSLSLSVYFLEK